MARPQIEQIRGLGDFASLFRWNLTFAQFPTGVTGLPSIDEVNLRCESTDIPKSTNQKFEVGIRGHKIRRNGIQEYSPTLTFTFVETVDNKIHNFIRNWREAIWATKTGVQSGPSSTLQAIILIQRLDNLDNPIWEYKLNGSWLEDYEFGQLDGQTSDAMKPQMIISYDYFDDKSLV
jgi:hypothetical protein